MLWVCIRWEKPPRQCARDPLRHVGPPIGAPFVVFLNIFAITQYLFITLWVYLVQQRDYAAQLPGCVSSLNFCQPRIGPRLIFAPNVAYRVPSECLLADFHMSRWREQGALLSSDQSLFCCVLVFLRHTDSSSRPVFISGLHFSVWFVLCLLLFLGFSPATSLDFGFIALGLWLDVNLAFC